MSRKFWFISSLILFILIMIVLSYMEDTIDITQKEKLGYRPEVSVVSAQVKSHTGIIRTFAEIKPRWMATLKAHVEGEIIEVSKVAMAGEQVQENELLIKIEDSIYKARLAEAKQTLAQANLTLLQEKNKSDQAIKDWERSGLKTKPSDVALNKPQVEIAEKTVAYAIANINAAEKQSIYTTVRSPFSGIVTDRFISIGQTVNVGEPLLNILNQSKLDITVSLNSNQWKNLSENWTESKAVVKNAQEKLIASAKIKRGGGYLDPQTRQYKLFLEIEKNKSNQVLAGEFVNVELPGKAVNNTMFIPSSSYTREGTVWYVDTDSRLRYLESKIVFYQDDNLIVTVPEQINMEVIQIVISPLASFISGKEVNPVTTGVQ